MSETRKTRTDLLNLICEIRKPQRYLEIGIQSGENFKAVNCPVKKGVDPAVEPGGNIHKQTSDKFFSWYKGLPFDLIFIDGDHSRNQTAKDFLNAYLNLNQGGLIVCHDALPHSIKYTGPEWCGTAYQAIMAFSQKPGFRVITWEGDHGCAIFKRVFEKTGETPNPVPSTFENLWANDAAIVNKSTWEEVVVWLRNLE